MDIKGLAAIVTGGASGLGRATATMLTAQGAKVAIFDLNEEAGKAVAAEIGGLYVGVNVADDASVTAGLDTAEAAHGTARILVNCAGIAPAVKTVGKENVPHPLDMFSKTITVNLIGTFNMISKFAARAAAAEEMDGEHGVIVNTASVAAYDGQIGQAAYSASKGGIVSLTLPMARDLMGEGIRVNAILPGIFDTPLMARASDKVRDALSPGASVPDLLEAAGWPDAKYPVLLVGHQPSLGGLIAHLLQMPDAACAIRKGSVWWLRNRSREGQDQTVLMAVTSPERL